jgi:hypothetical protein
MNGGSSPKVFEVTRIIKITISKMAKTANCHFNCLHALKNIEVNCSDSLNVKRHAN